MELIRSFFMIAADLLICNSARFQLSSVRRARFLSLVVGCLKICLWLASKARVYREDAAFHLLHRGRAESINC